MKPYIYQSKINNEKFLQLPKEAYQALMLGDEENIKIIVYENMVILIGEAQFGELLLKNN